MRKPKFIDYLLLSFLALIWSSAFFNIKIATDSFGPITIAFLRVFLASIPLLLICNYKKIKIEAFSKEWHWFAIIGFVNLVVPLGPVIVRLAPSILIEESFGMGIFFFPITTNNPPSEPSLLKIIEN